jgi:hypothetical protein
MADDRFRRLVHERFARERLVGHRAITWTDGDTPSWGTFVKTRGGLCVRTDDGREVPFDDPFKTEA